MSPDFLVAGPVIENTPASSPNHVFRLAGDAPLAPSLLDDFDVPEALLNDIALRHVTLRGICTIHMLSDLMKLPLEVTETIFRRFNDQQYCDVRRASGDDYVFSLSSEGRRIATERALVTRYAGPAPVSLKSWSDRVRAQVSRTIVTRERMREAFADVVVSDRLLDEMGPALISQRAMFLYGPSGTGKTTLSERLIRVYDDAVLVPHAVEVDGQIILVADTALHRPVEIENSHLDRRWLPCTRPLIAAGGELVTSMLELQRDESSGAWMAPLQMKANNGILLIDDFGRQIISPRELLNRWIVPLDRRIDFLSLTTSKFCIPFEMLVVFSTNLEPHELADEAFLRRIPNKILIEGVSAEAFDNIFRAAAAAAQMKSDPESAAYCRELCLRHSPDLRPCFPRDLCEAIRAITSYEGREPAITPRDLERAVEAYFI